MKLIFKKDDDSNISVFHEKGRVEVEFSYVEMIKKLIETKKLKAPAIEGDFSGAEKKSINSMVKHINDELKSLDQEWEIEE